MHVDLLVLYNPSHNALGSSNYLMTISFSCSLLLSIKGVITFRDLKSSCFSFCNLTETFTHFLRLEGFKGETSKDTAHWNHGSGGRPYKPRFSSVIDPGNKYRADKTSISCIAEPEICTLYIVTSFLGT